MRTTFLPFIAFDANKDGFRVSDILKLSILHHARYSDKYYLITNISEELFVDLKNSIGNKFEVIHYESFVSKKTNSTIMRLNRLWSLGIAKANHPATEQLCFLRWLLLRDWLTKTGSHDEIYLLHDWDDLAFEDPFHNLDLLVDRDKTANSFVASFTETELCQWMQPNLTFFTYNSILDYCESIDYFIESYEANKTFNLPQKGFLDDCLPWSYTINKYRSYNTGTFFNLLLKGDNMKKANRSERKIYFNTTIRTPEDFEKNEYFVPKEYNYSGDPNGMISLLNIRTDGKNTYVKNTSEDIDYKLINIHFTGTESKYALLNGYLTQIAEYYKNNKKLKEQLFECGVANLVDR